MIFFFFFTTTTTTKTPIRNQSPVRRSFGTEQDSLWEGPCTTVCVYHVPTVTHPIRRTKYSVKTGFFKPLGGKVIYSAHRSHCNDPHHSFTTINDKKNNNKIFFFFFFKKQPANQKIRSIKRSSIINPHPTGSRRSEADEVGGDVCVCGGGG